MSNAAKSAFREESANRPPNEQTALGVSPVLCGVQHAMLESTPIFQEQRGRYGDRLCDCCFSVEGALCDT